MSDQLIRTYLLSQDQLVNIQSNIAAIDHCAIRAIIPFLAADPPPLRDVYCTLIECDIGLHVWLSLL